MAGRKRSALDEKIKRVKEHVEMGTATEEEIAWLTKIDAAIALYGKPYIPTRSKIARRQRTINLNPEREKRQKRPRIMNKERQLQPEANRARRQAKQEARKNFLRSRTREVFPTDASGANVMNVKRHDRGHNRRARRG